MWYFVSGFITFIHVFVWTKVSLVSDRIYVFCNVYPIICKRIFLLSDKLLKYRRHSWYWYFSTHVTGLCVFCIFFTAVFNLAICYIPEIQLAIPLRASVGCKLNNFPSSIAHLSDGRYFTSNGAKLCFRKIMARPGDFFMERL